MPVPWNFLRNHAGGKVKTGPNQKQTEEKAGEKISPKFSLSPLLPEPFSFIRKSGKGGVTAEKTRCKRPVCHHPGDRQPVMNPSQIKPHDQTAGHIDKKGSKRKFPVPGGKHLRDQPAAHGSDSPSQCNPHHFQSAFPLWASQTPKRAKSRPPVVVATI
jgi:hypothetical protein